MEIDPDGQSNDRLSATGLVLEEAEMPKRKVKARQVKDIGRPVPKHGSGGGDNLAWRAKLVERFLSWPLPQSVCGDLCVTDPQYKFPRSGTNLLTADEARQMIDHLFANAL